MWVDECGGGDGCDVEVGMVCCGGGDECGWVSVEVGMSVGG